MSSIHFISVSDGSSAPPRFAAGRFRPPRFRATPRPAEADPGAARIPRSIAQSRVLIGQLAHRAKPPNTALKIPA
jgi:hypothetical protein